MGKLFGTDGVRGIANSELTGDLAYALGRAGAYVLTKEKKSSPKILVAMDTRISGDMLESALVAGICSVGAHAISVGVIPTPAVAYLVRKYNLDAGVMISASHNPVEYNGIKFFNKDGYKLPDALEEEIEHFVYQATEDLPRPTGSSLGRHEINGRALQDYVAFLIQTIDHDLDGLKVVLDCANGAAYQAGPLCLRKKKADVAVLFDTPNGTNINDNCGSTHMGALQEKVKETGANVGIAFDGDADRCLAVDENGEIVDGDQIIAICSQYMKQQGLLKDNTIVVTVMSNLGLYLMGKAKGIHIEQTSVGDRYVLERMLAKDYILGGEQSGHVIFLRYNTTGDGILTALQLLSVMKKTGKPLSELKKAMEVLPQVMVNAYVDNSKKYIYMENQDIRQAIIALEEKFSDSGRVLIRASGTEPLVRVMLEGKNTDELKYEAEKLAKLIEEKLG